jgi:3-oxoacyl-[acyl-carrier-protein] synthase-3
MDVGILGIAYHLPPRIETNADLARENPDWRMKDVFAKTGIDARHIAAVDETASDLGYCAAVRLLEQSLVPVEEIDYLLYCTQSPDYFLPSGACILQHRLGLGRHVAALDYNLGCSGFIYGLQMAKSFVQGGFARHVLLITADTYSRLLHPRDRTVRVLFGDGAAATLVGPARNLGRVGHFVLGTDGSGADKLIVPGGAFRLPRSSETGREVTDANGCIRSRNHLFMDGPAIFAFAITTVPRAVDQWMREAQLAPKDVDWYVYHQANQSMLDHLASASAIPREKLVLEMEQVGNTVSASIPIALERWVERGRIRSGHRLLLVGFGVGYSWGVCDVTWD